MGEVNSDFNVAVHALVYLDHSQRMLSSDELAENICTNAARVRKVMAPLRQAGLVETREGHSGGYRMSTPPKSVSLSDIADALQVRFVESTWRSGDVDRECLVASGMGDVMDTIYSELDTACRGKLAKVTVADVEDTIFNVPAERTTDERGGIR